MTYAFTFDASACSGCKACQEACKDKNSLPAGMLWRRVIEVSGGEWHSRGKSWENSVFAYNLSIACNHCTHPKCAGVCPTGAYTVRPDGIVLLNSSKCMGCGYCAWACPYGAPQYDAIQGIMSKCDFCFDNLDAGMPPTCVSACPLRVLEYGALEELGVSGNQINLWQHPGNEHPYPLPGYSRTEPHLAIKPHPGMENTQEKLVGNREEILPPGSPDYNPRMVGTRELPLVAFTLLAQMAVGMAICGLIFTQLPLTALLTIGILMGLGGLISFLHLGRKRNAWRAVTHLRKSWLSREVLMAGLFSATWAVTASWGWSQHAQVSLWPLAILGLGLVYCMGRVYLLRAVARWNSWRTPLTFLLSAAVLGVLGLRFFAPIPGWYLVTGIGMAIELAVMLTDQPIFPGPANTVRAALLGLGILVAIITAIKLPLLDAWSFWLVVTIALLEQILGRWQFYAGRVPFPSLTD